jgi:lipopolysaccharide export system permease protein
MKIIDWYIIKRFLTAFFFTVIIMVTIVCIINLTEMNDKFIKHNLDSMQILKYYLSFGVYIANLISPIMVFIAAVYVTAKMASHTEIIAILSSGVSFRRMMRPYLIGSMVLAALIFSLVGFVIPETSKYRVEFDNKYLKAPYYYMDRNVHFRIAPDVYAYLESYSNSDNIGYRFTLEKVVGQKLVEKLKCDYLTWIPEKKAWKIKNYEIHRFDSLREKIIRGEEVDTVLNLLPKDFASKHLLYETLTLPELDRFIKEQKERGIEKIERYVIQKYTIYIYPFSVIILTLIGVIVSARKSRGGAGFQIALGFLIAFIYILFVVMSTAIADAGNMSPLLAVLLPNIVFGAVGVALYFTIPR